MPLYLGKHTPGELWRNYFQSREIFLSWAAGFFDGEGCVLVSKHVQKDCVRGFTFTLQVSVVQIGLEPLELFLDAFGGRINEDKRTGLAEWRKNKRIAHRWVICSGEAVEFLKEILPFSVHKREEIELATAWKQKYKKMDKGRRFLTDAEYGERERIRDGLMAIRAARKEGTFLDASLSG